MSDEVLVWLSVWSEVQIVVLAYGPADATAYQKTASSLASFKSRLVLPFWYQLTQVVLENRPLNRCSSATLLVPGGGIVTERSGIGLAIRGYGFDPQSGAAA